MAKDKRNPSNNSDSKTQSSTAVILQALAAKATGGLVRKPEGDTSSGIMGVITAIGGKLLALLGPIALLGAAVSSSVSGMQPFLMAIKMIGSVLGAFLAPIFITMAAVITAVIDTFQNELIEAIKSWAEFIWTKAITVVDWLVVQFYSLGTSLLEAKIALQEFAFDVAAAALTIKGDTAEQAANKLGSLFDDIFSNKVKLANLKNDEKNNKGAANAALGFGGFGEKAEAFGANFKQGLRDGIEELKRANGPQAESNDLIGAARKAQLAALNQSPYEAKMLDLNQKILGALQDALNNAMKPAVVK